MITKEVIEYVNKGLDAIHFPARGRNVYYNNKDVLKAQDIAEYVLKMIISDAQRLLKILRGEEEVPKPVPNEDWLDDWSDPEVRAQKHAKLIEDLSKVDISKYCSAARAKERAPRGGD